MPYEQPAIVRSAEEMGITTHRDYCGKNKFSATNNRFADEYDAFYEFNDAVTFIGTASADFKYYTLALTLGDKDAKVMASIDSNGDFVYGAVLRAGKLYFVPKFDHNGYKGLGLAIDAGKYGFWVPVSDITKRSGWHDLEIGGLRAIADYHILEGTKPIIHGKYGDIAESVIVRKAIGKAALGLTGAFALPLAKRLLRELFHMKKADPRKTTSAMTTTDEYRNYRANRRR